MEGIHGVDVSWLHHSQKDHRFNKSTQPQDGNSLPPDSDPQAKPGAQNPDRKDPMSPIANPPPSSDHHHYLHRPHLTHRASSERVSSPVQVPSKNSKDPKGASSASPVRRNSWITNISSKFSTSTSPTTNGTTPSSPQITQGPPSPQLERSNPFGSSYQGAKETKKSDPSSLHSSSPAKSGHPSFIQNALRRLSSSGGGMGKMAGSGGACERKVMNVDPHRERCQIENLEPSKLRRVAFCVDVEIAGTSKYSEAADDDPASTPSASVGRRPSLSQLENQVEVKKKKENKLKEKDEGEALKHPEVAEEEHDADEVSKDADREADKTQPDMETPSGLAVPGEIKDTSRKKEKKKRSEEERKERKERKKRAAVANGTVPVELSRENSSGNGTESPSGDSTSTKAQDRPTTDPLRIYRRCCQLRETPILKRITEQLSLPSFCDTNFPEIVSCLDLSGYWMQLPDVTTLGDFLAVVPVRKLILENCGLTDEAIRIILASLLAVKTQEQARHNRHLAKKSNTDSESKSAQLGVVEKLSLKNNPKIGREGWRHIWLFIYMSKSLKAIDLSTIPFPQFSSHNSPSLLTRASNSAKGSIDMTAILYKTLSERFGGSRLEELVMAECGLTTEEIEKIVDGVIVCGCTRLGLASNSMTLEGLKHVTRFVATGKCEGLDLGGNDVDEGLPMLAETLDDKNPLYALSLADCNLSPSSLASLFPAIIRLPNFRFIDLSQNRRLFATQPNALNLLRKYLPQLPLLKRLHLADVSMSPEHAIALAEVLPEITSLAHLNILDNHQLTELSSAKDEASQEEACALYASLMAAVRVSDSIVCIDVDVPGPDSSEIVKALAKQVVAYSLRNMDRDAVAEAYTSTKDSSAGPLGGEKAMDYPEILLHLVGHVDDLPENHDDDEPPPDDDYIVGGTGVVKALGVCLGNRAADYRRPSLSPANSGTAIPKQKLSDVEMTTGKAKNVSKNLLGSARKIRARLQPALAREAKDGNDLGYRRLKFLESTLERMIQRFEDEYPETRLPSQTLPAAGESTTPPETLSPTSSHKSAKSNSLDEAPSTEDDPAAVKASFSRHNSDVSIASRYLAQEEGRMHRFGQQIRRDILRPQTLDYAHGTTGDEVEEQHLKDLRERIEAMGGEEIKEKLERDGKDAVFKELGANAEELLALEKQDPEGFEEFRRAQMMAYANLKGGKPGGDGDGGGGGGEGV